MAERVEVAPYCCELDGTRIDWARRTSGAEDVGGAWVWLGGAAGASWRTGDGGYAQPKGNTRINGQDLTTLSFAHSGISLRHPGDRLPGMSATMVPPSPENSAAK